MKTLSRSVSTTTLCSVGYGSETTRTGGTSPPAMVALSQPGGHDGASSASISSRQPFSRSSASSLASDIDEEGTGQIIPSRAESPVLKLPIDSSMSPAVAMMTLRI